ncbi:hypothetical protein R50073_18090 [Maricurvus nonylphenolicus]
MNDTHTKVLATLALWFESSTAGVEPIGGSPKEINYVVQACTSIVMMLKSVRKMPYGPGKKGITYGWSIEV